MKNIEYLQWKPRGTKVLRWVERGQCWYRPFVKCWTSTLRQGSQRVGKWCDQSPSPVWRLITSFRHSRYVPYFRPSRSNARSHIEDKDINLPIRTSEFSTLSFTSHIFLQSSSTNRRCGYLDLPQKRWDWPVAVPNIPDVVQVRNLITVIINPNRAKVPDKTTPRRWLTFCKKISNLHIIFPYAFLREEKDLSNVL